MWGQGVLGRPMLDANRYFLMLRKGGTFQPQTTHQIKQLLCPLWSGFRRKVWKGFRDADAVVPTAPVQRYNHTMGQGWGTSLTNPTKSLKDRIPPAPNSISGEAWCDVIICLCFCCLCSKLCAIEFSKFGEISLWPKLAPNISNKLWWDPFSVLSLSKMMLPGVHHRQHVQGNTITHQIFPWRLVYIAL